MSSIRILILLATLAFSSFAYKEAEALTLTEAATSDIKHQGTDVSVEVSVEGLSISVPKGFVDLNVTVYSYANFKNIPPQASVKSQIYINHPGNCNQVNTFSNQGNFTVSVSTSCIIWGPIN